MKWKKTIDNDLKKHFKEERQKILTEINNWKVIYDTKMIEHLSFFNDGLIAIISTIMVLGIPLPTTSDVTYFQFLRSVGIFLISFFITIYFWYKSHQIASILKKADKIYLILNFLFIACLSLIPVLTKWMMEDHTSMAVVHMGTIYLIINILLLLMTVYAYLQNSGNSQKSVRVYHRILKVRLLFIVITNAILIVLALLCPMYAMIIYVAIPILSFLTPSKL